MTEHDVDDFRFEDFDCGIGRYTRLHHMGDYEEGFWEKPCPRKSSYGALIHDASGIVLPIPICAEHKEALSVVAHTTPASPGQVMDAAITALPYLELSKRLN